MNLKFFKTNWFYFALGILLLVYTVRKYPSLNPLNLVTKGNSKELASKEKGGKKRTPALFGLVPDDAKKQSPDTREISDAKAEAFLKRFTPVALSERKKFGIPASVLIACAYVNSQAGQSEASLEANNFFALDCEDNWEGETTEIDGNCMRKYESAWASFRDFSIYLSSEEWFGSLKKAAGKDGEIWMKKIRKEGFANTKEMQKVMEAYNLYELDSI